MMVILYRQYNFNYKKHISICNLKTNLLLLIVSLFFFINSYSQQNAGSPNNILLNKYLSICGQMKYFSVDSLCKYAQLAHLLAYNQHDEQNDLLSKYYCADCLMLQTNMDSAQKLITATIAAIKDSVANSRLYEDLGQLETTLLMRSNKYKDAVASSLKYLAFAEKIKDTFFQVTFNNSIGLAHMKMLQKQDALTWFRNGLAISSNQEFYRQCPFIYGNMGIVFATLGQWDSTAYYTSRAITCDRDSENLTALSGALPALGALYMETNRQQLARAPFEESLSAARKLNDPYMITAALISNATYLRATGDYKKSIGLADEAIDLIMHYHLRSQLSYTYQTMAEDYKLEGDYKNYAAALENLMTVKDSSNKINSTEAINDLQVQYEVQKKENEIIKQRYELRNKNFWIYGGFVLSATIILFSIYLFRANKGKQKIQMQLMQKEEQFKGEQAIKDAEEKERQRVAAELHDDMGTRINILSHAASRLMDIAPELGLQISETSNDLMQSLRETVWTLKQESILVSDVWVRFKNFVSKLRNTYSLISFDIKEEDCPDKKLQYNQTLHLIRTLQEAAGNAVKHSSCSVVSCEKKIAGNLILFRISDNGKGFSIVDENNPEGNGIPNMRQRSKESGFEFVIKSTPGSGTCVEILV